MKMLKINKLITCLLCRVVLDAESDLTGTLTTCQQSSYLSFLGQYYIFNPDFKMLSASISQESWVRASSLSVITELQLTVHFGQ